MPFKEVKDLSLNNISLETVKLWKKNDVFNKSFNKKGADSFIFYEGPPSANGKPGIHHVMARTIKDIFCRYKTLKGYNVVRKAGWDTHGLPIELGVEKELGITKDDIGSKISIKDYNTECKKAVMKYTSDWESLTELMGFWIDMSDPYVTYTPKYMESIWWLLKEFHKKNLLYKGYTIQPYSPAAGTGLSSHELNQPGAYKNITDTSIVAQFKCVDEGLSDNLKPLFPFYFLAWTTTPWTLPSNTALAVGMKISYSFVKTYNQYTHQPITVVLANDLIKNVFAKKYIEVKTHEELGKFDKNSKNIPYLICEELTGKNLIGLNYEQIWAEAPVPVDSPENAFRVIAGDFVTTDEGTGIVHTAPTFGMDDYVVAINANPPVPALLCFDDNGNKVPLVDLKGKFVKKIGQLSGKFVKNDFYPDGKSPKKSVDVEIAIKLKEENLAFKVEKYSHSYPHCWRTDKPVLYYPMDSWFIKVSSHKEKMVNFNKSINWNPKSTGEGRFGNWLAQANDWNLSRSRYWGVPIPIWINDDGTEQKIIGSVEELIKEILLSVKHGIMKENPFENFEIGDMSNHNYDKIDLHKDVIDKIILCSSKNEPMKRENDIIDVWFDSGSMPYAQLHYPFENKELIDDGKAFPADFIAEGVDQTRGWFYTLHVISTLIFDSIAYKNVISNGLVLDKEGQKMSKRLGNTIDPFITLKTYGADATRWYLMYNSNPWDNLKFNEQGLSEVHRKFFGTLHNVYSFFSLYANIDGFNYSEKKIDINERSEIDKWIISELNSLIELVDQKYSEYDPTPVARAIYDFVQEKLSNWYVRLSRRRFWKGEYNHDKISAYQTLFECILAVAKLSSPIAPFYSDFLYRCLTESTGYEKLESIHLSSFPVKNDSNIDKDLEDRINKIRNICSLALSIRKKESIKVRQPLTKIFIPIRNKKEMSEIDNAREQIVSEINVKNIEYLDSANSLLVKELKPNFKTLGPRFGNKLNKIVAEIRELDPEKFNEDKGVEINIDKEKIVLSKDDIEVHYKDIEGLSVASGNGVTIAIDLELNDTLIDEGIARELISRIQNVRKASGFEVTDKIEVKIKKDPKLISPIKNNLNYILSEILATKLYFSDDFEKNDETIEFDGIKTVINLKKV